MLSEIRAQRLLALFVLGWLVFNFPLLGLWDQDQVWFGLPLLPVALLALWLGLIVATAWLMRHPGPPDGDD